MSVVRLAELSDVEACAEIARAAQHKARFAQAISTPGLLFLVAEWGGAPVGFLIAAPDATVATARIDEFQVEAPGLWPSVGQHLLREARARLKERGVKRIVVSRSDPTLLRSEGFVRVPTGWAADA